jgi:hypothetical protein
MPTEISGSTGVDKIQSDAIEYGDLPTGSVLQVVNWRSTAYNTATTSQSYVDAGIAATITPSSTSSKILVIVNLNGMYKSGNNAVSTKLLRDSTDIGTIESMNTYTSTAAEEVAGASVSYLDSPNTNSAVTYKIQFASISGDSIMINVRWNSSWRSHSTITLMEIAG